MSNREDLFTRALAGELAWDAEELEQLRRASPEEARELDDLLALQGTLDARELGRFDEAPTETDHALVASTISRLASGEAASPAALPGPGSRVARRVPAWLGLAAAVMVVALAGWWWSSDRGGAGHEDIRLGASATLEALVPVGAVDRIVDFRVAGDLSKMVHCELRIWAAGALPGTRALIEKDLTEAAWTPTEDERNDLHGPIRWELIAYGRRGNIVGRTAMIEAVLP